MCVSDHGLLEKQITPSEKKQSKTTKCEQCWMWRQKAIERKASITNTSFRVVVQHSPFATIVQNDYVLF